VLGDVKLEKKYFTYEKGQDKKKNKKNIKDER
jgi:hypothetical protein